MKPYSVVIQRSETDQLYLVHLPEFPTQQFVTHGNTYEAAARNGQEAIDSLVEWYKSQGKTLPQPSLAEVA